MTIGDILAVIAAILLVGASWAATILVVALAFPLRVVRAEVMLTEAPGRCALRGVGVMLAAGLLAAICAKGPGPVRLLALVILGAAGAVAALGSAAMARLLAARIDALGSPMAPYASLTRASVLYVSSGFLPVVGWFFVLPAALFLAVGSGVAVLRAEKKPLPVSYAPASPTGMVEVSQ